MVHGFERFRASRLRCSVLPLFFTRRKAKVSGR